MKTKFGCKCRIDKVFLLILIGFVFLYSGSFADELERYKVKREKVFEFEVEPSIKKLENSFLVSFKAKAYCDVTIKVVNSENKIVRHIVSGLLGDNAPTPLAKKSLQQEIIWDLKDDQGKYIENLENYSLQICLGLKPEFERTLYWDPQRKLSIDTPVAKAIKEGVLIYNGKGVDHLIMVSHTGEYLKTIYPYPSDVIESVSDIQWNEFPQGGRFPKKYSFLMQTLLTSGNNADVDIVSGDKHGAMHGSAATAIGVNGNKVCLVKKSINRLTLGAVEKSFKRNGSVVTNFTAENPNSPFYGPKIGEIYPKSVAFSPDGKWVYLAGYYHMIGDPRGTDDHNCLHGVTRVAYDQDTPYEVFLGKMTERTNRSNNMKDAGSEIGQFACATSVACDKEGRIYVSDYMNNRIQIFTEEGKFIKAIQTPYPSKISFHPITGDIYVLSWVINNPKLKDFSNFISSLHIYGSFDNPVLKNKYELPFLKSARTQSALPLGGVEGSEVQAELDLWGESPALWVSSARNSSLSGIHIYQLKNNSWVLKSKLEDSVKNNLGSAKIPIEFPQVQNLYVNEKSGNLYIGEPDQRQNFRTIVEINPLTGKAKEIPLPYQVVDMAFDAEGAIYLRKVDIVGRYDISNWREIPFDYGVEAQFVDIGGNKCSLVSGLPIPSIGTNQTYQGGMSVSPNGNIAISCINYAEGSINPIGKVTNLKYQPIKFAGRQLAQSIHIWDKYGKVVAEDAIPGLGRTDGVWLDVNNNLFIMSALHRNISSKIKSSMLSSTIIKILPKKGRGITDIKREDIVPLVLPVGNEPKRTPELYGMSNVWVDDFEWMYGGVGFSGKHLATPGAGCCCWHSNFALDYFGRSFATEIDQYCVAVLDSNGNLITKIGKYGNIDDGIPLIKEGGSPNPKSIGGDEVGLFHACYVATHSDNRLFIADYGNGRVVSVKLNYHQQVKLKFK
jgi:DNA-binding beta-propeller fold protein YncE